MKATLRWIAAGLVGLAIGGPALAGTVTVINTSSSIYEIRGDSLPGNPTIALNTAREGSTTYTLQDSVGYRLYPGQLGDQGNHYFIVNGSGDVVSDGLNQFTRFFYESAPNEITIASVPVYMRQISGDLTGSTTTSGGGDAYFAPQTFTAYGAAGQKVVNLVPDDRSLTLFGGFIGNWKNTFPYNNVQQAPFQLGPLTGYSGNHFGITSMTLFQSSNMGTIVPGSLQLVTFFEGTRHFRGYQFMLDRTDSAQPGDGSQFLFFTEIPEPTGVAALAVIGGASVLRRRRCRA